MVLSGGGRSGARRLPVADEETLWATAFAAGGFSDAAVAAGTGERVALRVPEAVVANVTPGLRPHAGAVHYRGPVVFTDRRVLAAVPGGPEWPWSDRIDRAFAEASGCGVMVIPTVEALADGDHAWGVLAPSALDDEPPPAFVTLAGLLMWNRAVAAWRASRGELEAWVQETSAAMSQPR
jgi:hypothetical protein